MLMNDKGFELITSHLPIGPALLAYHKLEFSILGEARA